MAFSKGSVQSPAVLKKSNGASRVGYGAQTVAQRLDYLANVDTFAPPFKTKPSIHKFISQAKAEEAHDQIKYGDGRVYPGSNATDLVYRTLHNALGGTKGNANVRARFVVGITDLVNAVSFEIQLDPNYLGGVSVVGIATDDSGIATSSITEFALTDNGAGNYTFGPWTSSGAKSYYGFQIRLDPVDDTNDETLHDEYFIIQSMTITQNGNDLLNSTEALGGSTWAQQIKVAWPASFSLQTLQSANGNDVYITHVQLISGATYRRAYCSPTGTGDGGEFTPMSLTDARTIFNSGACQLLLMEPGVYSITGPKVRDVFVGSAAAKIIGIGSVLIDASHALPFSSMVAVANHYEIDYDYSNHYNVSGIPGGTYTPKIVMETLNENFTEVTTAGEVDTTDWSFYWDNSNEKFLIRFDGTQTDDVHVCEAGNLFYGEAIEYIGIANTKMKGFQGAFAKIDGGDFYETYKTGTDYGNAAGMVYDIDNINGLQVDDYVKKCQQDAFNYHGYGHSELFDCVAEYNKDDGCSHHDDCTGYMQGGRYDYNGKGGVIPAFGAYVICYGVQANGNAAGNSPLAQNYNFGGFVSLSDDSDSRKTVLSCVGCTADGNYYNFLSSGGASVLRTSTQIVGNALEADFGSKTWGSNSGYGALRVADIGAASTDLDDSTKLKQLEL